jgi:NAD dependent epimerase/dehydratase family enzyme
MSKRIKIEISTRTRATGQNVNHLYKIPTKPKCDTSCNNVGYYPSRREREKTDNSSTKEGYCKCGRKDEEGSYGCIRYPSCINDSGDDGFY